MNTLKKLSSLTCGISCHIYFLLGSAYLGTDEGQSVALNTDAAKPPISNCSDNFLRLFKGCPCAAPQCLWDNMTQLRNVQNILLTDCYIESTIFLWDRAISVTVGDLSHYLMPRYLTGTVRQKLTVTVSAVMVLIKSDL